MLRKEIEHLQNSEKSRQETELNALKERQKIIEEMTRDVGVIELQYTHNACCTY